MSLIQERLDVKNKTRSNPFNWRGQFTPQFVDYLLESFSKPNDVVADPFVGSGTVLLECSKKHLEGYGFEINPAAYAMSKIFSFSNIPIDFRLEIISSVESKINNIISGYEGLSLFEDLDTYRESYKNLLNFTKSLFNVLETSYEKIFATNLLFIAENSKEKDLFLSIRSSFKYLKRIVILLPFTNKTINVHLCDARSINKYCSSNLDLIITSPPYINVFNYHQNHRAILEILGWDLLNVAQSEFGSNRKNRGNRFKTVVQYCLDMEQALNSFWDGLKDDGLLILVVGKESNVRKIPFYNGTIVRDILEKNNKFCYFADYERNFVNKFGNNIKEEIFIYKKSQSQHYREKAREVALKHLNKALSLATGDVKEDILDAINSIENITPSPLFKSEGIFLV